MNKLIKQELEKVSSVKLEFDDSTTEIFIPKTEKILSSSLKVGKVYLIELNDEVLNPSSSSTFSSNWNQGRVPTEKKYIAEVVQLMGDYVKINGVSPDDPTKSWFGWVPFGSLQILEKDL